MVPQVGGGVYPGCMPSGGSRRVDIRVHEQIDQLSRRSWSKKLVQEVGPRSRRRLSTVQARLLCSKMKKLSTGCETAQGPSGFPCARARWPRRATSRTAIGQGLCPQLCSTLVAPRRQQDSSSSCSRRRSTSSQPAHAEHASSSVGWRGRRFSRRSSSSRRRSAIAVRVGELTAEREEQRQQRHQQRHQQRRQQQAGEERDQASREEPPEQPAERRLWWWSLARWGQAADSIGCQWPPCSTCGAPWRPLFALSCLCCRVTVPVRNIVDCM